MSEKTKHDSVPPPINVGEDAAAVSETTAKVKTPQEFRHLLRDGYRYLLQTSALGQKVDVPKSVAFFLNTSPYSNPADC